MFVDIKNITTKEKVLLTDSRFLSDSDKSIFFAIKGERHDGHKFIRDLYAAGLREFVVEEDALTADLKDFLEQADIKAYPVASSTATLQLLAAQKREKYTYPVVGITGSNGKTIVKEWLSSLLEKDFEVVKSPRSYNSQIGVALSVWEMSSKSDLGIFEAGISQPNEMHTLEKMVKPTLGIFTNIGSSHSEGFVSKRQKIREKLLLFKEAEALVYCRDYQDLEEEIEAFLLPMNPQIGLISWSAMGINRSENKASFVVSMGDISETLHLPFTDAASIENAIHCAYAGLYLLKMRGVSPVHFFERFRFLNPVEMRLELKEGREGNYVIDDTYNNDLGGLKMALNFMSQTHTKRDKVLILSDMFQSGLSDEELMSEMTDLIRPQKIKTFIGIGEKLSSYPINLPDVEIKLFQSTEDFLKSGLLETFQKSLILIKGARVYSFEQIVERLVKRIHGTVLEINLDAITYNLNYYRSKIGQETKLMVMVKAFAYGSGNEVAAWLQYHRVDYLTVAYPDEGTALRQNGISLPIMVMNADPDSYSTLFEHNLEPEIYSFRVLEAYLKAKSLWDKSGKIHLKIDTGMHRLGFVEAEIPALIEILNQYPTVEVASIFSHLVGADSAEHNDFSRSQIELFERASTKIMEGIGYQPLRHICNTAGIIRFPEARYDMVRLGIGMYGVESSGLERDVLETVTTLKTTISQIKTLPKGETVGYSRRGVLERDSRIATIAIGYADGYDRGFGRGNADVMVNGTLCKTVGNVCMDMTMIDVTEADCAEGDEVIIFGKNPTISNLAEKIETIPYEILTGVSERVKRVFYHQ
jgi:alanine racemase